MTRSRRTFLQGVLGTGTVLTLGARRGRTGGTEEFLPQRDGFGFRNWSSRRQEFDTPRNDPSPEDVHSHIKTGWADRAQSILGLEIDSLADPLVEILTTQLHSTLRQRAGTNGHCYGMCLTAQAYHEEPQTIPMGRETAAAIAHPTEPLESPTAPVYEDIVSLQAAQFLQFRAWLGRRAMLWPDRINVEAQLRDVRAVIDTFGTAAVTILSDQLSGHQVLAYDYADRETENGRETTLSIYDPNYRAGIYDGRTFTLEFADSGANADMETDTTTDSRLAMKPYGRYTRFLFNRYDRIDDATGRSATPLDHLEYGRGSVRESLFPVALVTADTAAVDLSIARPNGGHLNRLSGEFMDRTRGDFPRMQYAYGVENGRYRVTVYGQQETDYEVRVRIAGEDGARLDTTRTDRISGGESHVYTAAVPATADEEGTLERQGESRWAETIGLAGVGVGLGAAGGVGAYHLWNRREAAGSNEKDGSR